MADHWTVFFCKAINLYLWEILGVCKRNTAHTTLVISDFEFVFILTSFVFISKKKTDIFNLKVTNHKFNHSIKKPYIGPATSLNKILGSKRWL